jgi:hypothetical protein
LVKVQGRCTSSVIAYGQYDALWLEMFHIKVRKWLTSSSIATGQKYFQIEVCQVKAKEWLSRSDLASGHRGFPCRDVQGKGQGEAL